MLTFGQSIKDALRRFGGVVAFAAITGGALAANWVNPHSGMSGAPVIMVIPGMQSSLNICAAPGNSCDSGQGLTTTGNATLSPLTTKTTVTTFGANGSQTTTTNSANSPITAVAGNLVFNLNYVVPGSSPTPGFEAHQAATLSLGSLNAAAASMQFCSGFGCGVKDKFADAERFSFTATPDAANGTVTINAFFLRSGDCGGGTCFRASTTITLALPPQPPGSSSSAFKPGVDPPPPANIAVKGPEPSVAAAPPAELTADEAQAAIDKCGVQIPNCVADALEAYANHLDKIADKLPPSMRTLARTFHEAARQVREAKTPAAALRVIKTAIAQVKISISLIRAVDADTKAFGQEVGAQSVGVLQTAQVALSRVSGL